VLVAEVVREVVNEGEAAHEVDLGARRVEDAGLATLAGLLRDVDQRLVNLADHLGVNGHFLVERRILGDGEIVALEETEDLLESPVDDPERLRRFVVETVRGEEAAVQVRGHGQGVADVLRHVLVPACLVAVVERLEEEDAEPAVEERVWWRVGVPVRLAECGEEVGVVAQPPLALHEVQEHAAVEELESVVVGPVAVLGLLREVFPQQPKDGLVFLVELFGDGFNVERLVVLSLNLEGRQAEEADRPKRSLLMASRSSMATRSEAVRRRSSGLMVMRR